MARKRTHEEPENLERWLVSYADFITLLFAFFVVLYAISSVNEGKYKVVSESLVTAFTSMPRSLDPIQIGEINRVKDNSVLDNLAQNAPIPVRNDPALADEMTRLNLKEMADEIEKSMQELISEDLINVRRSDDWLEVEINTSILFPSGSAQLVEKANPVLNALAVILAPFPNPINVEGFTDNVPISTELYPSNWELSAARAASVVHLFARNGVAPERMSAIAYGEYKPIADNSTSYGRSKNRRVVLAILAEDFSITQGRPSIRPKDVEAVKTEQ